MIVKVFYSKKQLEDAAEFLSLNNKSFLGKKSYIKKCMLSDIEELAQPSEIHTIGSMGYILTADKTFEDMDNDEYSCSIEIYVNPSVSKDSYDDDNLVVTNFEIKEKNGNI